MNEYLDNDVIELGTASLDTRGGPMGYEDSERTFWLTQVGLTED